MVPLKRFFMMLPALAAGLSLGWVVFAQDKPPEWMGKDGGREEYDLFDKAAKATDAKQRLTAIDEWKNRFPDTNFWGLREEFYLVTHQQLNDCRKTFDTAVQIRQKRPKHFLALNAILSCVYALNPPGQNPNAGDMTASEQAAKFILDNAAANIVFAPDNKPAIGTVTDEQLKAAKPALEKAAQQTYAWVFVRREEWAKAEPELRKFLTIDPSQAAFSLYLAQSLSNQARANPTGLVNKYVESMFHFARAASYNGQNALPAAAKEQALNFLKTAYTTYHGSDEGMQQLLTIASANVMPPANFAIKDINTIRQEEFAKAQAEDAAHPDLTFWRDFVKGPLTSPNAASLFENNFMGALLPGMVGAEKGVTKFKGTIHSHVEEKGNTKALTVAVADPTVPDATLEFLEAMPGTMPPGATVMFEGVVKSYMQSPFNVVFELDDKQIEGWTGEAAAKGKGGKGKGK